MSTITRLIKKKVHLPYFPLSVFVVILAAALKINIHLREPLVKQLVPNDSIIGHSHENWPNAQKYLPIFEVV